MGNKQSVERRGNNQSVERVGSNTHVSDTRKTSNGCDVARRVSRNDAEYCEPSKCVAAIDFGTTNCSVAYILPGEDTNPNMLCFHGSTYRVPTAILFNDKGAVKSFGLDAFKDYCDLEDDKLMEYAYFERIKMNLHNKVYTPTNAVSDLFLAVGKVSCA